MTGISWSASNAPMRVKCIHRCLRASSCSSPVASSSTAAMPLLRVIVHFVDARTPIRTTYTRHPDSSRSGSGPGVSPDDRGAARLDAAAMQLDPDRAAALLDRLYRTAILITRDPHEAEDLVQDTYEQILRRPRELAATASCTTCAPRCAAATSTAIARRAAACRQWGSRPRRTSAPGPARSPVAAPSRPRSWRRSARCRRSTATCSSPRTSPGSRTPRRPPRWASSAAPS